MRDFGEKFPNARIEWNPKKETLRTVKSELIAENPDGKKNGLQYFADDNIEKTKANIKLAERLKETMPNLTNEERHTATIIFDALAKGAGMDAQTYLDTYYSDEILTNTAPADLEKIAAQEEIDTKDIKGAAAFKEIQEDIKALIYVGKKADFSTFVHEAAHIARKTLTGDLLVKAESAFDVKDGKWTRAQEEAFAQGFEQYLKEGIAPTEELKNVFQKAAEFLSRIYKNLKEIIGINDDIRKVYDELLGKDNSTLKQAEEYIDAESKTNSVFIKNILSSVEAVKQVLEGIKNKDIKNNETGITARLSSTGINKMTSNKAVEKSEKNGFTRKEHYGAVAEIKTLYEKAKLANTHTDIKNERSNIVSIKRFTSALTLADGKSGEALITLKETEEHGHRIYSLELDEIIKPEQRWGAENDKPQRWETAQNSGTPTAQANSIITETSEAINTETTKSKINEVYEKATEAARQAVQKGIRLSEEQRRLNEIGDILFQTAPSENEVKELEAVRAQYENTDKWLKAPNGKDTNLNEKQWLQVRTDSFKKWFGDWENDAENASKVVDENGEPLVVYHGTGYKFDTFSTPLNMERIFLTKNKNFAHKYGNIQMPLFVNAKNVLNVDYKGADAFDEITIQGKNLESIEEAAEYARENGYTALIASNVSDSGTYSSVSDINDEVIVFKPNQIKSAVGNKGSFDSTNDNIYFQTVTEAEIAFKETADTYRAALNRYFTGEMKSNETVTVCKKTPVVLRAVGFDDKPITVSGATLKHITDKHKDITQEVLNTLPEQLLDPVAVFKSQNKDKPNSRLIFTEHFINGKPVLVALEMNYKDRHGEINSIRSVYERDITAKSGWNILQDWIDSGNMLYIDDKRADEWSAITGVSFPLEAFSKLTPSNTIIGETAENVKSGIIKKSDITGENAEALYFQVEKEFYDEVAQTAETADSRNLKEYLKYKIIGEDDYIAIDAQEMAEAKTVYNKAFTGKVKHKLQKGLLNEAFMEVMENDESLKTFVKQCGQVYQIDKHTASVMLKSAPENFMLIAESIALSDMYLGAEVKKDVVKMIQDNTLLFRNVFAEINGFKEFRTLTEAEQACIDVFYENFYKKENVKTRSEVQDEMFLEEIGDDAKFNEFLNEAARIYFFDFDNFKALDEQDAAYRDEMERKQDRLYRELRNFSWKGTLAKIKEGKTSSAKSVTNIKGQIKNAARSYRSLYADIMDRADMKVRDAETTDSIIKTKLKSRPYKSATLEDTKLEYMSNAQKERLLKALNNEELEERAKLGILTVQDVENINGLIKEKNANIKDLEKQLKEMKKENADNTRALFKLQEQIKNERISRKVLADTVRARDGAFKSVMKRINLKACNADEAEALSAVQWFLKTPVQKALNATVDKQEPRFREAYTLWKTNEEYRQRLARTIGHKKGWYTLRNILENKEFSEWTNDDKKLAQRLIPARNKFFSLGLEAKTEKNFLESLTGSLSDEKREELMKTVLPDSIIARLKHRPLSQWTVDELIDLAKIIEEKHREGKQKFLAKKADLRNEAFAIRNASISALRSVKGYNDRPASWSEDERGKKGGFKDLRRKLKYAAMRPYAFIEMLDGGRRGTLYDLMEYEQRECYNRFKAGQDKRTASFNAFLEKENLSLADFDEKIVFENFYDGQNGAGKKDLTLTVQEVLGAYIASFDEKSRAAVQYGNFAEQAERDLAKQSNSYGALDSFSQARYDKVLQKAEELMKADGRLKAFAEYLQAEYKAEGERLRLHNRQVNNTITEIRDNYFPMVRLDVLGEEDARQTQKKIVGEHATGTRHGVEKGQTKARIEIGKANQSPIKLGALNTYLQSVEANERLYAYDAYAQKLNRVFKGYDSKQFRKTIENAYGYEAVKYLDKQVNTIIDPTAGRVYSDTDKLLRVLRGNTAAAYLGWKMSGIIKQGLTSPAPFLQYVNPVSYTKAAFDLAVHNKEMYDFIYARSKLMQDRSFDMMQSITEELHKNAKTKAGKALTKAQEMGMQGLEWVDRVCVAPGWLAAFREEEARLKKANNSLDTPLTDLQIDLKATQFADDVLVRTQPSGRAEELAPLFREGGEALRMLLQFQSSLNVIYNNIRHDLPNAIRNKQYKRAAGIVTGYALAGIMTGLVTGGFEEDDDEKDIARRTVYYAFTQYTDSVPVISGIVDSVAEKLITGKTSYRGTSSLYATIEKAAQGTAALADADIQKAALKYAEAAGLSLGLPTSGAKEAVYAIDELFSGEFPGAVFGRRKKR